MTEEVLFSRQGQIGLITLNRPKALNALTLDMLLEIQKHLSSWKEDDEVKAVVVQAVPGNAFCAGGDIRAIYFARGERLTEQLEFFWHEYRLNHFIHHFGKPYISLMDGMTMGGGVGISLHGSHPVASERFVFAMPETGIGFFPDIGASYLLNRCPGSLGMYLGMTGNRLGAEEALQASLVKQVVNSHKMPELLNALLKEDLSINATEKVDACLQRFAIPKSTSDVNSLIDECFAKPTVERICESLELTNQTWASEVLKTLGSKSPLSLKITFTQLQKAKNLSLADCLKMDYDMVWHFLKDHDFYEGVRALLIDKDKNPQWNPERLELVTQEMVVNYFEREGRELTLVC